MPAGYSYHRKCRLCGAEFTAHTAFAELRLDDTICTKCEKEENKRINQEIWEAEKTSGDICSVCRRSLGPGEYHDHEAE